MKKDIFKSIDNYMKGFMSRNDLTQTDINRYTATIHAIRLEIMEDLNKAPEIIQKWKADAELESLRIQFTASERKNRHDIRIMAVQHVTYALADSRPLGKNQAKCKHDWVDHGDCAVCKLCGKVNDDGEND